MALWTLSAFSVYYDPWHPPCSICMPRSLFPQSLSKFSLVYLLAWHPQLHTPIHFFTQSLSSFCSTRLYHRNLFCCSTKIMSCNSSLSLNPLLGTLSSSLTPHIHLISDCWSATSFSFLTGQVSLHATYYFAHNCCTLSLTINDISLLVSYGTNCMIFFHPIWVLVSTDASASHVCTGW